MNRRGLCLIYLLSTVVLVTEGLPIIGQGLLRDVRINSQDDWSRVGEMELQAEINHKSLANKAKNVIIFIGDGMSISTVTATRIFREQTGNTDPKLSFEKFPNIALSKTYDADTMVPDSSSTATAILSGVKTRTGTFGVNQNAVRGNCSSSKGNEVDSILHLSLRHGKSAGVVTTARLTHATPAAAYAHGPDRNWESDGDVTDKDGGCTDIAYQLINDNPNIQVLMGGGRKNFYPNDVPDEEYPEKFGKRTDNISLVQVWKDDKNKRKLRSSYVWNLQEFNKVDTANTDYLLGLFEPDHMQYELDRNQTAEPSLAEMVAKSIQILRKNEKGYFLEVEAGRIDHAHHDSNAIRAITDTMAFSDAVQKAVEMVDLEETLIVVTADHSHVFTIGGYASRNVSILGLTDHHLANDNMPYTVLAYTNGPGYSINTTTGQRENLTDVDTAHADYKQQSAVPLNSETHSGEEVGIYAVGPMSHLFRGSHEQNFIAHAMVYASCVGTTNTESHCAPSTQPTLSSAVIQTAAINVFICVMLSKHLFL